jgi:hypothetical protein
MPSCFRPGRVKVVESSLGKVSVVQMERAVVSQASWELSRFWYLVEDLLNGQSLADDSGAHHDASIAFAVVGVRET